MIPKVIFRYSWIYDEIWKKGKRKHTSEKKILNYIKSIEKIWRKYEKSILKELSKITGLKWKETKINCYVVGRCIPFSDPLTMPVYKNKDYFIDVLIHELIHNLFIQKGNYKKSRKAWNYIFRKYKTETKKTKIHIPLHAFHSHIYFKFFNKKRLERDKKFIKHLKDYRRSWKMVEKEGYENIIKEFRKRV